MDAWRRLIHLLTFLDLTSPRWGKETCGPEGGGRVSSLLLTLQIPPYHPHTGSDNPSHSHHLLLSSFYLFISRPFFFFFKFPGLDKSHKHTHKIITRIIFYYPLPSTLSYPVNLALKLLLLLAPPFKGQRLLVSYILSAGSVCFKQTNENLEM